MYSDLYNDNHVQISAVQIITTVFIVILAFILPAGFIQYRHLYPTQGPTPYTAEALAEREDQQGVVSDFAAGRVAGVSTTDLTSTPASNTYRIPLTNLRVQMNSQTGLLITGGGSLVMLGLCLLFYVMLSDKPEKEGPNRPNFAQALEFELRNLDEWA